MANEQMRENWTLGAKGWVQHRDLFDGELEPFAVAVIEAAAPGPGDRVLDVGCGTGTLVARSVARGAEAIGVDLSPGMVEGAQQFHPEGTFLVADAQTDDLAGHGPFTTIVSRFGVMFFDDPTAAFANIRRAAAPGARLVFACWRSHEENAMFTLGTSTLLARLDPPLPVLDPAAPGPTALADPDRTRTILADAGWTDVGLVPCDAVLDYARNGGDGVEERLTMVLNTNAGRMAQTRLEPQLGPDGWAAL
ncbi:MAG TPA: methyltransferase domain-containing protein, partial [Acidimicrobiales bacterium]|nr:methyltransferase domain-containing protein [Acidimicrobiales bacterium]